MTYIVAILAFCVIIIIHELGHFVAAKACGIQVNEFAIGMGPKLFRWQKGDTTYAIRLLPIGGFVSMEGEDNSSDNPRAFNRKPVWQRMIVIVAGAVMNLVLGYFVVLISLGVTDVIASTTISSFREASTSSQQLEIGDRITKIDDLTVFTASDIMYKLQNSAEKNADGNLVFDITVNRGGEKVFLQDVEFTTRTYEDGTNSIYFDFTVQPLEKTFANIVPESFKESLSTGRLIIITFIDLLRGRYGLNDLSGPIGTVDVVAESVGIDFGFFLQVFALITINVGIFNLLPIPALDGCRFLFLIIEAIRRKPMKPEVEGMVHFVGLALLMVLMVVVTFNDIARIFSGG